MKKSTLTGAAAATLLCSLQATAGPPEEKSSNGIQFYEFDFFETVYIECLGEYVDVEEHISAASHAFTTPSGNFHVVDNWKFSAMWTGVSTGRIWIGQLTSPYQGNVGPGYVEQWSVKGVQKPITEGAPKFFYAGSFKTTVNANGELVVLNDASSGSVRCLGNQ